MYKSFKKMAGFAIGFDIIDPEYQVSEDFSLRCYLVRNLTKDVHIMEFDIPYCDTGAINETFKFYYKFLKSHDYPVYNYGDFIKAVSAFYWFVKKLFPYFNEYTIYNDSWDMMINYNYWREFGDLDKTKEVFYDEEV